MTLKARSELQVAETAAATRETFRSATPRTSARDVSNFAWRAGQERYASRIDVLVRRTNKTKEKNEHTNSDIRNSGAAFGT